MSLDDPRVKHWTPRVRHCWHLHCTAARVAAWVRSYLD